MTETLLIKPVDVDALADLLADAVVRKVEPLLAQRRKLVDRPTMAELAGISVPALDRMVAAGRVPGVTAGSRRQVDPNRVIDAMTAGERWLSFNPLS